ncbi:trypsin-like peptidase domain-containing protein [Mucilaginibacter sp. S1162]|uniref:Trypsin-like peptidase domain-containing protein n=1 Tax=Mucilaginibacter humi TaxID=2732510 RepID=A0ABX1W093_9SPHI|nr:serine protease [Mucilaginibacter humi]NNU33018.1 trypsin-like peptidase domain-containing protein [Mucilaginibacter humi]
MSENQLLETIERYLNGEMKADERKKFELLRKEDAELDSKVVEHKFFTNLLKQYGERVELENRLNAIHDEIDVHTLKESLMVHPVWIVQMWRNHHSKISVAASVAIFGVFTFMLVTGKFNNNNSNIEQLKNEVNQLHKSTNSAIKSINDIKSGKGATIEKYSATATGFAITSDGLIATNYHVVRDASAVSVQNADGDTYKAEVLYTEPLHDIAILKITDSTFEKLGTIPYTFKRTESSLAEQISTYGYPDGFPAYNPGYLSSLFGQNGDTLHYKVTMPINPGNSGGPLWDSKGNVIGITDSKQAAVEGEHFAIKAKYLLDAIKNIPADSLDNKIVLSKKNTLTGLTEAQKAAKAKNFVFMVKVY